MSVLYYNEAKVQYPSKGVERRIAYTDNLLVAVLDFTNGPQSEPDPMHSHPHEQISYIAEGEIIFFLEGEEPQTLKAGDVFMAPSGKKHCIQLLSRTARLVDSFSPVREDFL